MIYSLILLNQSGMISNYAANGGMRYTVLRDAEQSRVPNAAHAITCSNCRPRTMHNCGCRCAPEQSQFRHSVRFTAFQTGFPIGVQ